MPPPDRAADAPARSAELQFQHEMRERFAIGLSVARRAADDRPFRSQITSYCGGRLCFATLRFSPHTTSSAHVGQLPSRFLVSMHREGSALVQQDGREARIGPDEFFVIDPSRPFHIETDSILVHSVYLPQDALRNAVPHIDSLLARRVDARSGTGALFASFLKDLDGCCGSLDESQADHLADALPSLVAATLSPVADALPAGTSKLRRHHKQRVLRYAIEHLRDGDLDGLRIAAGVQLSRRYVYELFAEDGKSLMKWIWAERLARCRRDLASRALLGRTIGDIAFDWGFNDLAHFSRAFKAAFGSTPSRHRAASTAAADQCAAAASPEAPSAGGVC